jgi:hypothetical protein
MPLLEGGGAGHLRNLMASARQHETSPALAGLDPQTFIDRPGRQRHPINPEQTRLVCVEPTHHPVPKAFVPGSGFANHSSGDGSEERGVPPLERLVT